jgi:hypothetical protein
MFNKQVDVERRVGELSDRQALQPLLYLRLQLNNTSSHSNDAIPRLTARQHNLYRTERRPRHRFAQCQRRGDTTAGHGLGGPNVAPANRRIVVLGSPLAARLTSSRTSYSGNKG